MIEQNELIDIVVADSRKMQKLKIKIAESPQSGDDFLDFTF